jgi:hypothetical protein
MNTHEWTESRALDWLAGNFRWNNGVIKQRPGYVGTHMDLSAITFLVTECGFEVEV